MDNDNPNKDTNINPNSYEPNTRPISGQINPNAPAAPGRRPAYSDEDAVREENEKYGPGA